jgi:D-beta-D-heptose 7-phosphate kinase / D-beta-D-heptose 1-phosphate adenosyltransferase
MSQQDLRELLEGFAELTLLVTGDPMTDVYHFGHVDRLSPEAPVPVFIEDSVSRRAGGAANVAAQLRALNIGTVTTFPPYDVWTEKHRYLVGHQQLFRIDNDIHCAADWSRCGSPKGFHALVVSDYNKGALLGPTIAKQIAAFRAAELPVVVDPKGQDWDRYRGATVICPNHLEFPQFVPFGTRVVEKRGPDGLRLHHLENPPQNFPSTARHVFDVSGAGDTVTALIAATLAAKGTLEQACELANLAAGYVVGEVGTAVCPLDTLKRLL